MYQNNIFNEDEWKYLQMSLPMTFLAIAGADDKIDKKEKAAMNIILTNDESFSSELMKEVLHSIGDDGQELIDEYLKTNISTKDGLKEVNSILERKIDRKDAMEFKKTLIAIGAYIGDSSGRFLQSKLSQDEEDQLVQIGYYLDVPVKGLMMTKIMERLLAKVKEN